MKFNRLDIIPSKESNLLSQEIVKKLNNSRLSTESRTPPQETVKQEVAKLNITEKTQLKHSKDTTEKITECIHKICHDIFLSENELLDIDLFYLGKDRTKIKINLLKSLELVVYKTLYGHSWATVERANSVKFEECKSYPYTVDDIGIQITTLQQYYREWTKLGYLEKLHDEVKSHPEFSELKELRKQHLENFNKQLGLLNDISTSQNDEKAKLWSLKNDNLGFEDSSVHCITKTYDQYQPDFETPLILALIRKEQYDLAIQLINDKDLNIHVVDTDKQSALTYAIEKRNVDLIKLLAERGVNTNTVPYREETDDYDDPMHMHHTYLFISMMITGKMPWWPLIKENPNAANFLMNLLHAQDLKDDDEAQLEAIPYGVGDGIPDDFIKNLHNGGLTYKKIAEIYYDSANVPDFITNAILTIHNSNQPNAVNLLLNALKEYDQDLYNNVHNIINSPQHINASMDVNNDCNTLGLISSVKDLEFIQEQTIDIYGGDRVNEENSVTSLDMNKQWDENLTINCNLLDIQSVIIKKEKTFEQQKQNIIKLTKDGAYLKECSALNEDIHSSINFMNNYLQLLKNLYNEGYNTLAFRYWSKSCRSDLKFDSTEILEDGNMSKQEIKEQNKYLDALARLIDLKLSNNKVADIPCVATTIIGNDLIIGLNTNSNIQSAKSIVDNIIKLSTEPTKLNAYFNIPIKIDNITKLKNFLQNKDDKSLASGNSDTNKSIITFYDNFFGEKKAKYTESEFLKQLNNFNKNSLLSLINKLVEGIQLKSEVPIESKNFPKLKKAFLESPKLLNYQKQYSDIDQLIQNSKDKLEKINIIYTINGKKVDVDLYTNDNSKQIMHAEISIIEYIKSNPALIEKLLKSEGTASYVYMGNNKKACPACHASIEFFNETESNPFTVIYRGHHHDFDGLIQLNSSNYDNKIIEIPNQEIFKQKLDQLNQYQYASFIANGKENKTILEKMYKIFIETHDKKNVKDEHNPTPSQSVAGGELRDEIEPNAFNRKYDDNYSYNKEDIAAISNKLFTQKKLVELQDKNIQWQGIINKDELDAIKDGEAIVGVSKVNEHYVALAICRSGEDYTVLCRDAVSNEWENYKTSDNFEITVDNKKIQLFKNNLIFSLIKNDKELQNSAIYALNDAVRIVEYVNDNQSNLNQENFNKIKFTGKPSADAQKTTEYLQSIYDAFLNFEKIINQDSSETLADLDPIYQGFKQNTIVGLGTLKNKFSKISYETLLHTKISSEIQTIRQDLAEKYFDYHVEQREKENTVDFNTLKTNLNQLISDINNSDLKQNILVKLSKFAEFFADDKFKDDEMDIDLLNIKESEIKIPRLKNIQNLINAFESKIGDRIKDGKLFLNTPEEIKIQIKAKLGNPEDFNHGTLSLDNSSFGDHDDQESLKHAKPVQGFYSDDDVMLLIQALLKSSEYERDDNPKAFGKINDTNVYILNTTSLSDGQERLEDLARDVCKILLKQMGTEKIILIPMRLQYEYHWVTAQLKIGTDNKITSYIHDSLYDNKCINDDIIFELSQLFSRKEQIKQILEKKDCAVSFNNKEIQQLNPILNEFEIKMSVAEKIQQKTHNVYCGGYTAHIIANLVKEDLTEENKKDIWSCKQNNDGELRKLDATIVNNSSIQNLHLFGTKDQQTGNLEDFSKKAEKDRDDKAKHILERIKEDLKSLTNNDRILSALKKTTSTLSCDKAKVLDAEKDLLEAPEVHAKLRELQKKLSILELNNNPLAQYLFETNTQGELKLDKGNTVVNSYYQPNQLLFFLIEIERHLEASEKINGINQRSEGLTRDSINLNIDSIIQSNNQPDLYISSEVIDAQDVSDNILNWAVNKNTLSQYAAIVKIENDAGKKHAILLHVKQKHNYIEITLIDPLSQENSEFIMQLNALKTALSNQISYQVQIVYAEYQDQDYGTCGDMCLIMLQELIEKTVNETITSVDNEIIIDQYIDIEQIKNINNLSHNFDYDNHHPALLGQDHNETI